MKKIPAVIGGLVLIVLVTGGLWYMLVGRGDMPDATSENVASSTPQATGGTFTEDSLGFSFTIPGGYHAQKLLDDTGETILVQSADSQSGFQVYITPTTDLAVSLTKARIEKEAKMTVANDAPLTLSGGAQGLQFDSTADSPPTRQAWFIYNGYLYQAQTWASNTQLLGSILASWTFTQ